MTKKPNKLFKAGAFFSRSFPFYIKRFEHTAKMFNEKTLHQREFWKVIYVESGSGSKIINGHAYSFEPGSLFLIHPDDVTSYIITSNSIVIYNIVFWPEFLGEGLSRLTNEYQFFSIFKRKFHSDPKTTERLYVLNSDSQIKNTILEIQQEYDRKNFNYQTMLQLLLMQLLIRMGRKAIKSEKKQSRDDVVAYIDHVIDQNYRDDFSLSSLASELGIDKTNLCRMYKQATGSTIVQRLLETRLKGSCLMLLDERRPISDACYECGFNDLSYFYRTFKKYFRVTPKEYRLKKGASINKISIK